MKLALQGTCTKYAVVGSLGACSLFHSTIIQLTQHMHLDFEIELDLNLN